MLPFQQSLYKVSVKLNGSKRFYWTSKLLVIIVNCGLKTNSPVGEMNLNSKQVRY